MQHMEVSGAVRPLKWSLGVKWLCGQPLKFRSYPLGPCTVSVDTPV